MTSAQPLDWIKQIDAQLVRLDEKPQFGTPAPLDWQQLETDLRSVLNKPELTLTHSAKGWVTAGQLLQGLGENIVPLTIEWSPLESPVFFVTGEYTLNELMGELLATEEEAPSFYDPSLVDGFCSYFTAQILRLLSKQSFAVPLSPRIGPQLDSMQKALGDESCFAIDVSLQVSGKHLWGRVLLSESFRSEWKIYFAHQEPPPLTEEMRQNLMVDLGLEVGQSRLKFDEWKKVKIGDYIILDHCSYDPDDKQGSVVLTLQQKPLFRGRIKEGGIKLTNYPIYEEVTEMNEEDTDSNQPSPLSNDEDNIYGDLDDDDDASEFDEDEELFADLEEESASPKKRTQDTVSAEGATISPEQLPVQLTVEVGRVRMTAGELLSLTPGNLLDLHVAPEQGVDLVVNGKKVGRGELIRMGDLLGVRILNL